MKWVSLHSSKEYPEIIQQSNIFDLQRTGATDIGVISSGSRLIVAVLVIFWTHAAYDVGYFVWSRYHGTFLLVVRGSTQQRHTQTFRRNHKSKSSVVKRMYFHWAIEQSVVYSCSVECCHKLILNDYPSAVQRIVLQVFPRFFFLGFSPKIGCTKPLVFGSFPRFIG